MLFLLIAIAPIIYLIIRYRLFEVKTTVQLNLWQIVAILFFGIVITTIGYYCVSALKTKYFWWKQIVVGVVKLIIPLSIALVITTWLSNNINILKEFLIVTIICESIAIVINPLPKWCFENNIEGLVEIGDKVFHRN